MVDLKPQRFATGVTSLARLVEAGMSEAGSSLAAVGIVHIILLAEFECSVLMLYGF